MPSVGSKVSNVEFLVAYVVGRAVVREFAAGFGGLSVQVDYVGAAAALVEVVYILGNKVCRVCSGKQ